MTVTQVSFPHQYLTTYSLYVAAFAGAGITLLALVSVGLTLPVWATRHPRRSPLMTCLTVALCSTLGSAD